MALPSSGVISIAMANAEFGLGNHMAAYYGCDVGVPTSGPIHLSHLYGKASGFAFYRMNNIAASGANVGAYEIRFIDVFGNDVGATALAASSTSTGAVANLTDNNTTASNYHYCSGSSGQAYKFSAASRKRLSKVRVYCTKGSLLSFDLYGAKTSAAADNAANMTFIKRLSMTYAAQVTGWNEFTI